MIKWLYLCFFSVFTVLLLGAYVINKSRIQKLNCNNKYVKIFYGVAIMLIQLFPNGIGKTSQHVEVMIKKLSVKDKVTKEKQEYILEKISITLMVIYLALVISTIAIFVNEGTRDTVKLQRNDIGQGETVYNLEAVVSDEVKNIEIVIPERTYSEKEAQELISEAKNSITKTMLDENISVEEVRKKLNLVTSMCDGAVQVNWEIENDDVVGYDGEIGEVPKEGTYVNIKANLTMEDYSDSKSIKIKVYPIDKKTQLQEYLQKYVYESKSSEMEIELPSELDGEKIHFIEKKDDTYKVILPVAIIIALIIFFLKDRDLNKDVEKRNQQMLNDYPEVVSKLLLLTMTGMSVRKAFEFIVKGAGEKKARYVYGEISLMLSNIQSGGSEYKAYEEFGKRCGIYSYIRLMNIINQNLKRGSNEMGKMLKVELDTALLEKKNNAMKIGETAGTKLLAPMIILLIISLVIIAAPALMSLRM